MSEDVFAKLFTSETYGQILITKEYDEVAALACRISWKGLDATVKLSQEEDTDEAMERRDQTFADMDLKMAEEIAQYTAAITDSMASGPESDGEADVIIEG